VRRELNSIGLQSAMEDLLPSASPVQKGHASVAIRRVVIYYALACAGVCGVIRAGWLGLQGFEEEASRPPLHGRRLALAETDTSGGGGGSDDAAGASQEKTADSSSQSGAGEAAAPESAETADAASSSEEKPADAAQQSEAAAAAQEETAQTAAVPEEPRIPRKLFYGAFTWGSPAWLKTKKKKKTGTPPVPVVRGLRMYTVEGDAADAAKCKVDIISQAAGQFGFVHPSMPVRALSKSKDCTETPGSAGDMIFEPSEERYEADLALHALDEYDRRMPEVSKTFPVNRSDLVYLMRSSYVEDDRRLDDKFLMPIIGYSYDKVFKQHSWLFIRADDRQCFLTFKGAEDAHNMSQALNIKAKPWCNLGKVHGGFRKRLQSILEAEYFESEIKIRMVQECRGLVALGHSMGGAMAEMFAACFLNADFTR